MVGASCAILCSDRSATICINKVEDLPKPHCANTHPNSTSSTQDHNSAQPLTLADHHPRGLDAYAEQHHPGNNIVPHPQTLPLVSGDVGRLNRLLSYQSRALL
eukprot:280999-Amphidinium_carterae.1